MKLFTLLSSVLALFELYHAASSAELKCQENECLCVSAGGHTCGVATNGACDTDECYDRDECPGYGYWCTDAVVKNCYCEFDDQDADFNGIMCNTTDGASRRFGSCDAGQSLNGTNTENYASRKTELCGTTEAPATEAAATETPATEARATEAPATEALATEAPATDALATEAQEGERSCIDCIDEFAEAGFCVICTDAEECDSLLPEGCNHCGNEIYEHCNATE